MTFPKGGVFITLFQWGSTYYSFSMGEYLLLFFNGGVFIFLFSEEKVWLLPFSKGGSIAAFCKVKSLIGSL
ncbi:MAG: hypothetical protein WAQ10_08605 [Dethiobacteria bacterium]